MDEKGREYLVGSIRIDGIEPSKEFLEYAEKEKNGTLTQEEIEAFNNIPHKIKEG